MSSSDSLSLSVPPALAIVNARVRTGDPRRPWADAVLMRSGRLEAVGSSAEIRKRAAAPTKVIDARGLMLLPLRTGGFLAHGSPADLMLVDPPRDASPDAALDDTSIVLAIEAGYVVLDRGVVALDLGGARTTRHGPLDGDGP